MSAGSEQFLTLLERLDRSDDNLRIAHGDATTFTTFPATPSMVDEALLALATRNIWFEVNSSSFTGPDKRSSAQHITRRSALDVDIDYKAGGMGSMPAAEELVSTLSGALGVPPAAIVHTGHGLQAYWPISDGVITDDSRLAVADTLARWKVMCQSFARALGGQVDSIFDLPRILRMPGSTNWKEEGKPVEVYADFPGGWESFTIAELAEVFDEHGIIATPDEIPGGIVSGMEDWEWAERDCQHVASFVSEMLAANPASRHGWLLQQAALIYGMVRYGCVTEETFERLRGMLDTHFHAICANSDQPRVPTVHEIRSAFTWGGEQATLWSSQKLIDEMRQHVHNDFIAQFTRGAQFAQSTNYAMPAALQPPASPDAAAVIDLFSKRPIVPTGIQHIQPLPFQGSLALSPQAQVRLTHAAHSDVGNAEMFAGHVAGRFLHVAGGTEEDAGWHMWDGSRWQRDIVGMHKEALKDMLSTRLTGTQDPIEAKWLLSSMNSSRMNATLKWAESVASVRASPLEMDSDSMELATPGGIVNLRNGTMRTPNPLVDRNTKQTTYAPVFGQPPAQFVKFLTWMFGGQADVVSYVQRLLGAAVMGEQHVQVFPVFIGEGDNGKSVLFSILKGLLGDYVKVMPGKFLIKQRNDPHPEALASLRGVRLALASEIPQNCVFDEELVKSITGDTTINARKMRENSGDYPNHSSIWLVANHLPGLTMGGKAWWRRARKINMIGVVAEHEKNPLLSKNILDAEGAQILGWIIEGALSLLANGEMIPDSVKAANREWRNEEDSMSRFISDNLIETAANLTVDRMAVYRRYTTWATGERIFPLLSAPKFAREMLTIRPDAGLGADNVYVGMQLTYDTVPNGGFNHGFSGFSAR